MRTIPYAIMSLACLLMLAGCSGSGGGSKENPAFPPKPSSEKEITSFSIQSPTSMGEIDQSTRSINIIVPYGTLTKSLVAVFTTTGEKVLIGDSIQTSGSSHNDFSTPIVYIVTAADGTTQEYTVTITIAPTVATGISLDSQGGYVYTGESKTITATVTPSDACQDTEWTVDDSSIVEFNQISKSQVKIRGKKSGICRIKASTSNQNGTAYYTLCVSTNSVISEIQNGAGAGSPVSYAIPDGSFFVIHNTSDLTTPTTIKFPAGLLDSDTDSISTPFLLAETETTYALWATVYAWAVDTARGSKKYTFMNAGEKGYNTGNNASVKQPVTNISWRDAVAWCNAFTEYYNENNGSAVDLSLVYYSDYGYSTPVRCSTNDPNGTGAQDSPCAKSDATGFRLPTSNEYEFSGRYLGRNPVSFAIYNNGTNFTNLTAGYYWTPGNFASGATSNWTNDTATAAVAVIRNYSDSSDTGITSTAVVASRNANTLGLFDLSGNVFEMSFTPNTAYHFKIYGGMLVNFSAFGADVVIDNNIQCGWTLDYFNTKAISRLLGFRVARNK